MAEKTMGISRAAATADIADSVAIATITSGCSPAKERMLTCKPLFSPMSDVIDSAHASWLYPERN